MKLQLVRVDELGESHAIDTFPITFGRADDADIHVDGILTSRHHCCVEQKDGHLWLHDLNSTNGTLLNGKHVMRSQLQIGDVVTIGFRSFRVGSMEATADTLTHMCQAAR